MIKINQFLLLQSLIIVKTQVELLIIKGYLVIFSIINNSIKRPKPIDPTNNVFLAKAWYGLFIWAKDLYSCPKAIKNMGDIFLHYLYIHIYKQ